MRRHNNKVNGYQTRSPHDQILLTRRTGCTSLQLFTHHRSTCHITFEAHWPGRGHGTGHGVDGEKMSEWDDDRTAQMNHCVTSGHIISVRLWSNHPLRCTESGKFSRPLDDRSGRNWCMFKYRFIVISTSEWAERKRRQVSTLQMQLH